MFPLFQALLLDISGEGLSFDTIWDGPGLSFAGSLIMISVNILLYFFLAFYLDNVVPSELLLTEYNVVSNYCYVDPEYVE